MSQLGLAEIYIALRIRSKILTQLFPLKYNSCVPKNPPNLDLGGYISYFGSADNGGYLWLFVDFDFKFRLTSILNARKSFLVIQIIPLCLIRRSVDCDPPCGVTVYGLDVTTLSIDVGSISI